MANKVKKVADSAKDAIREIGHRTTARLERLKRDVAGKKMTAGAKLKSVVREGVENTKAGIDKTKRLIRDKH